MTTRMVPRRPATRTNEERVDRSLLCSWTTKGKAKSKGKGKGWVYSQAPIDSLCSPDFTMTSTKQNVFRHYGL